MSTLKVESLRHYDADSDALTLSSSGTITFNGTLVGATDSAQVQAQFDSAFPSAFDTRLSGDVALGNMTTTGYLRGPATFTIDPAVHGDSTGTLRVLGNLTVDGTTTTINSTTVTTADKNIVIAQGAADSAAADGAGITVDTVNASLTYNSTPDAWSFNKNVLFGLTSLPSNGWPVAAQHGYSAVSSTGSVQAQLFSSDALSYAGTGTYSNHDFVFRTNNTERMRIDSSGNVGIGAQTPSSMLHLNGVNPIITFTNSAGTSGNQGFRIAFDNDRLTFQRASDGGAFEANYLAINQDTGKIGVMITNPSEYLEFSRTAGKIGWGMNGNWGVRIGYFDDGGGTHGFHVDTKHSGTVTSESRFVVRADTGRVGIGTKNPRYNLEVEGSNSTAVGIAVDNNTGGCNIDLAALGSSYSSHGAAANEAWLYCQNNINLGSASGQSSSIKFLSGGSERARIDSNGTLESKVAQGTAHISNATGTATIANNGTVDFALFSGMIIGNNHITGDTTIWICGGGGVVRVSSTGSGYGSMSFVSGISGYRWTNNTGSSRVMSFMTFKTRNYA